MRSWKQRGVLMAGLVLIASQAALAQDPARLTEPKGTAITWAITGVLVAIVVITAFVNPKRSHR